VGDELVFRAACSAAVVGIPVMHEIVVNRRLLRRYRGGAIDFWRHGSRQVALARFPPDLRLVPGASNWQVWPAEQDCCAPADLTIEDFVP